MRPSANEALSHSWLATGSGKDRSVGPQLTHTIIQRIQVLVLLILLLLLLLLC